MNPESTIVLLSGFILDVGKHFLLLCAKKIAKSLANVIFFS